MDGRKKRLLAVFILSLSFALTLFILPARPTSPALSAQSVIVSTIEICTDEDWEELSTGQSAVVQSSGPSEGTIHDIPNAQPIWGQNVQSNSSITLTRAFALPEIAGNITGTITFVADDGVTMFLNGQELGNYDAQSWPPPLSKPLTNLQPGSNQFIAEAYNRPSSAWFEACAVITYEHWLVYLPVLQVDD